VRWPPAGGPASRLRETIVHNWADRGERAVLQRLNACLRLSFPTVIDYHRSDHRDHFHCDMNRGQGWWPRRRSTVLFVQEALGLVLGRPIPQTGRIRDRETVLALREFSGASFDLVADTGRLIETERALFARVAAGSRVS
jgi:hypothetical protein